MAFASREPRSKRSRVSLAEIFEDEENSAPLQNHQTALAPGPKRLKSLQPLHDACADPDGASAIFTSAPGHAALRDGGQQQTAQVPPDVNADDDGDIGMSNSQERKAQQSMQGSPPKRSRSASCRQQPRPPPSDCLEEISQDGHLAKEEMKLAQKSFPDGGLVISMRLINFMCHENLFLEFGHKINFIVGQNGSGKSAILTALMVCLGSTANKTQRAHRISDLIRENEPYSRIIVMLNNSGMDRFRFEEYGHKIIIERQILRNGPSAYRTKSETGRIVSAKRDEVAAICEYFRLQVDNPMTILTQDVAKNYLAVSSLESKYEFFLRGSYLDQLAADYQYMKTQLEAMVASIRRVQATLPSIREETMKLEAQVEGLRQIRTLHEKQASLKKELIWAHVHEKEQAVRELEAVLQELQSKLGRHQISRQSFDDEIQSLAAKIQALEDENRSITSIIIRPKETSLNQIATQMKMIHHSVRQLESEESSLTDNADQIKRATVHAQTMIDEDLQSQTVSQKHLRRQLESEAQQHAARLDDINRQIESAEAEASAADSSYQAARQRLHGCDNTIGQLSNQIQSVDAKAKQLSASIKEHARIYGPNVPQVLAFLSSSSYHGLGFKSPPIGPIGLFVKLRNKDWSGAVDAIIGRFLATFIVTEYEDRELLKDILKRHRCDNQIILTRNMERELREPPPSYLTAYRVLEFTREGVAEVLCSLTSLERILLCRTRSDALSALNQSTPLPNVDAAFTIDAAKITAGKSSQSFFSYGSGSKQSKFFDDPEAQVAALEASIRERQQELDAAKKERGLAMGDIDRYSKLTSACTQKLNQLGSRKRDVSQNIKDLRRRLEEEEPLPERSSLQHQLDSYRKTLANIMGQLRELSDRRSETLSKKSALEDQSAKLRLEIEQANEQVSGHRSEIDKLYSLKSKMEHEGSQFGVKARSMEAEVAQQGLCVEREKLESLANRKKALEYCHEVSRTRASEVATRELRQIERQLEASDVRASDLESIVAELNAKREHLSRSEGDMAILQGIIERLKQSLETRQARWIEFRSFICIRANTTFTWLMAQRGFCGRLVFAHSKRQLSLSVDMQAVPSAGAADTGSGPSVKDVKSLSGGEKSLATTCFLLSLWESMEAPLRCLDEFDVFMDGVNRLIVLGMLLQYAKSTPLQYIFITPQALTLPSEMENDPQHVRIIRMKDPERQKPRA